MTDDLPCDLDARLRRVAVDFMLPTGLRVDSAVRVAEDLVASGNDGEATIEVAALSRDSLGSDAEPLVRAMMAEHGIDVPVSSGEESEYQVVLRAFGYLDLPIHFFEGRSMYGFRRGTTKIRWTKPSSHCCTSATS